MLYLDKLLDELQIRFRDLYNEELKSDCLLLDCSSFSAEYNKMIKVLEQEAKIEQESRKAPRSYEQSDKSNKSVASMIKSSKSDQMAGKKPQKKPKEPQTKVEVVEEEEEEVG